MRAQTLSRIKPVYDLERGHVFINVFICVPVLIVCGLALMPQLPLLVMGIVHRIIKSIKDRDKALVVTLIYFDDVDQGNAHPVAVSIQNPLRPGIFFLLFSCQILIDVVSVDQRSRCIRNVIGRIGILGVKSV